MLLAPTQPNLGRRVRQWPCDGRCCGRRAARPSPWTTLRRTGVRSQRDTPRLDGPAGGARAPPARTSRTRTVQRSAVAGRQLEVRRRPRARPPCRVNAVLQRLVDGPAVRARRARGRAPRTGRSPASSSSSIRRQNSRQPHRPSLPHRRGRRPLSGRIGRRCRTDGSTMRGLERPARAVLRGRPGRGSTAPSPRRPRPRPARGRRPASGRHALVVAPTGSGKTLAAFLWSLDRLAATPVPDEPQAPLPRALRLPAQGPRRRRRAQPARPAHRHPARPRRGSACRSPTITVGVRSGDTPADERRRFADPAARHPHHHAGVAVPAAHLPGARVAARRRDGDRRRGPRRRRHQARRAPRAQPRAARRAAGPAGAARSGSRPRSARSTRSRRSSAAAATSPSCSRRRPRRSTCQRGRAGRGHVRARPPGPARSTRRQPARSAARSGRTSRNASSTSSRPPLDHRVRQLAPARRAAARPGSTRSAPSDSTAGAARARGPRRRR